MSAMKTPPSRLLNVENSSRASRPGTRPTARNAPPRSMKRGESALGCGLASSMRMVRRCAAASAVSAPVQAIPSNSTGGLY